MNKSQVIALFDQDQRKEVEYPETRRELTPDVVRHIDTSAIGEGMITYSTLNPANADDVIREQVNYFENIGQDFEWKLYDYDQPSDLKERLVSHGFMVEEVEAIMVLDLKDAPQNLWQPIRQRVQRITDPEKLADVQSIEQQVWQEDSAWVITYLGGTLRKYPEQMSVYVAYINGQPASAAWVYFQKNSQFASLYGGSTIRAFRKQGLYTALLAVRAQEARDRQVRYLTTDASAMSRPILEKFGFERIAWSYPCKWKHKSQKKEST
jgi:hypothetical protein